MRKFISLSIILYFLFPFASAMKASEVLTESSSNNLIAQRRKGSLRTNSPNSNDTWIYRGRRSGQLTPIHQQQQRQRQRQLLQDRDHNPSRAIIPTNNRSIRNRKRVTSPNNNNLRRSHINRQQHLEQNNLRRSHINRQQHLEQNNLTIEQKTNNRNRPVLHRSGGRRRSINPTIIRRGNQYKRHTNPNSNYTRKKINRRSAYRRINYPYISQRRNWRWYGGRRWSPNQKYWGGGFWGSFIINPTIRVIRQQTNTYDSYSKFTNYQEIEQNAPGDELFKNYQLTQVRCDVNQDLVFVYGPSDTLMCAIPNDKVPAGQYYIDIEDLVLVVRD